MTVPRRLYGAVFALLLVLTAATVAAARADLGPFGLTVALAIAGLKAGLVGVYFMHLRWSGKLVRIAAAAALLFLACLIGMTVGEAMSRGWV